MSLNPLNELKRRLDDDNTPLAKRICLAKNIVYSHHFPTAPKERVIAKWLQELTLRHMLSSRDLQGVLDWLNVADDLTGEFKCIIIQIVAQYVKSNPILNNDMMYIIKFLENNKVTSQLNQQIEDYLSITMTLLECLRNDERKYIVMCQRLFSNMTKYYKECKKKLEYIVRILNMDYMEIIFSFLDTEIKGCVIEFCGKVLFSENKKSFFISYLQTLIRKDNIEELVLEKGDNIQSVLKIMNTFFDTSKGNIKVNNKFIKDFIDVFVSCLHKESQIIFAFYIMVANFLNMHQKYIIPATNMPVLLFDEKIKRQLYLNMLDILVQNEVDISVRLTDTFGEKLPKVETKKTFMVFLQTVMMGQLKLTGKLEQTTLQIIKTALKLDPILVEQKMSVILPPIMSAKKNSSKIIEPYTDMFNCLLEILFKLSRGAQFLSQILPFVKTFLEACNNEQFELKQTLLESITSQPEENEKTKNKIINGKDLLPDECVDTYGRLTSDLMFRQNKELLESFQKDFEEHCLLMLEGGFVSPSIITLAEVLSAMLCSFLRYNKMADHTVPQQIAEDFWDAYKKFEMECLSKYGECILKLSYNTPLVLSFLNLCQNFAQLKLLNIKYSNVKLNITTKEINTSEVFDLNFLLPCLSTQQWVMLASRANDDEAILVLDNLILLKSMAIELLCDEDSLGTLVESLTATKSSLIKKFTSNSEITNADNSYTKVLIHNFDTDECKRIAKSLVKSYLNNGSLETVLTEEICSNILLLNALVVEAVKSISKCFDNCGHLTKSLNRPDFDIRSYAKEVNMEDFFSELNIKTNCLDTIKINVDLIKRLEVPYLEERYQLVVILMGLAIKKCCHSKKIRRNIDQIMQSIFELSLKAPDLYKMFSVEYIFCFEDKTLMNLLTMNLKTADNLLLIKIILETAVKRVKTDSEIVKNLVNILLKKKGINQYNLVAFSDPVFQISCMILPAIAKQKKAITTSAFRTILADLQERLHKDFLDTFKNIDFSQRNAINLDAELDKDEDNVVNFSNDMATLNAMSAYSLTLSKYCEITDIEEIKNLECLWSGLEYFYKNAVETIQNTSSTNQHVESSLKLITVILRYIKKLETHYIFQDREKFFTSIWQSIKSRLLFLQNNSGGHIGYNCFSEDISVALKFLCELTSVECFMSNLVTDLTNLTVLETPKIAAQDETASILTSYKVSKYIWTQCLKSNIVGPKCVALSKLMHRSCKSLRSWLRQHYDDVVSVTSKKRENIENGYENKPKIVKIDDKICELVKVHIDTLSEVVLAAKKISLDYKFIDTIFSLQHLIHYIMGVASSQIQCEISTKAFFELYDGCTKILNNLLVSREEVLEDRWPNYMQCYRALVASLCERSSSHIAIDSKTEDRLAETAYNIEKLTQSILKRKKHVSRIAAYTVADVCTLIEKTGPKRPVRQHLENSVALLIQASDSNYAMAFLKRALAGSTGQMTMTNLYTMYKRYHKYIGNS